MLRTRFNYLLAALYYRNRATMKFADDSGVVAIAKLQVSLVLLLYGLPLVGTVGRLWTHRQTDLHLTSSNGLDMLLLLVSLWVPVHLLAWQTERVVAFAANVEHYVILRQGQRTFLALVAVGLLWLVVAAKYNAGTL